MKIIEKFTRSKTGNEKLNEDSFLIGKDFVVVADGTTAKGKSFLGESDGRIVSRFVCECFKNISLSLDPIQILNQINLMLANELESKNIKSDFSSCSLLVYNDVRKEVFSYGDCMYKIGSKEYAFVKNSDIELAKIRSNVIKESLSNGATIDEIRNKDIGRQAIEESLKENVKYANILGERGYPVINGKGIVEDYIDLIKVDKGSEIILSTDGYPKLLSTLNKTEKLLARIIEKDPLCIDDYLSTKGVMNGNESFDDRTYIRLKVL